MTLWFWHGVRRGIQSTRYPAAPETAVGVSPGRPVQTLFASPEQASKAASNCPVHAIAAKDNLATVDLRTCIWCQRCHFGNADLLNWNNDYQWAQVLGRRNTPPALARPFDRSLHVMVVDAGDCGACLNEVKQLNNPFYNMHRLGIFLTATPRTADVLLVVGPVSGNMHGPLLKTYDAMPDPKRVLAVGTCAITGGVFGKNFMSAGGVGMVLPVDIEVSGDPPPPLAILEGLLTIAGRKSPSVATGPVGEAS
jgi:Ni,Fe-hydrogenase III small subunit